MSTDSDIPNFYPSFDERMERPDKPWSTLNSPLPEPAEPMVIGDEVAIGLLLVIAVIILSVVVGWLAFPVPEVRS